VSKADKSDKPSDKSPKKKSKHQDNAGATEGDNEEQGEGAPESSGGKPSSGSRRSHGTGSGGGAKVSGLRAEIEQLRESMDAADTNRTPLSGEALRAFYRFDILPFALK
jgi:hypothetical protein